VSTLIELCDELIFKTRQDEERALEKVRCEAVMRLQLRFNGVDGNEGKKNLHHNLNPHTKNTPKPIKISTFFILKILFLITKCHPSNLFGKLHTTPPAITF
jgi:hypothetical protein